jgi:S-(hydroxymethyl)glutathione dehydrogenase/alcohol dehydrogenase
MAIKIKREVTMKAAVCYEFGKPLVVEEVSIDSPGKDEVKVRIAATAICHSDIHSLLGELGPALPLVAGHESAGYVEQAGENVTNVKVGDPVVVSLLIYCGHCFQCVSGHPNMCETRWPAVNHVKNAKGQALATMTRVGSFAEYVIVDKSQVVAVPKDMPIDRACLLACGVITGFGAVVNRARVEPMSSVVVLGVGGVGINAIQGAAFSGARPIIAVDTLDAKLKTARNFGATHGVNAKAADAIKQVQDLTGGRGADYVFVTVGVSAAVEQGLAMAGPRSMTVIVGLAGDKMTVMPMSFIRSEKILTGSFMGTTRLSTDIPKLVDLYKSGGLKLDELITKRYKLEQINEAIESTKKGEALRNVIVF